MKNKLLIICLLLFIQLLSNNLFAQSWMQKTDIPDSTINGRWGAYCFSIGNLVYAGGGYYGGGSKHDLWEYNMVTDTWTRKADLPISYGRTAAVAFSINGKGYV